MDKGHHLMGLNMVKFHKAIILFQMLLSIIMLHILGTYQNTQNYGTQQGQNQYVQPVAGASPDELANRIVDMIKSQFGLKPKNQTYRYQRPYLDWFDLVALPPRYRIPDFSKFFGHDDVSTVEHIGRFLAQCGEAALKVRFFPWSLSGSAFSWFASLPPNSVPNWADLENKFHKYFFAGVHEMRLTDLTNLKQMNNESVPDYIQRFRDVRS